MKSINLSDLNETMAVAEQEASAVKGGYELKNVYITSYSVSGASAGFTGGVRVAAGDVNGDG